MEGIVGRGAARTAGRRIPGEGFRQNPEEAGLHSHGVVDLGRVLGSRSSAGVEVGSRPGDGASAKEVLRSLLADAGSATAGRCSRLAGGRASGRRAGMGSDDGC